jgi:competence protein ComGC
MIRRSQGGFTLIETVLGLTVMVIMITAISQLFVDNLRVLTLAKARNIGVALANEQVEYLRDLPYDSIKTQLGAIYPPGLIPDTQVAVRGGYTFTMMTEVIYVDDPYDGNSSGTIAGKPKDLNPADYKRAEVSIYLKSSGQLVAQLTTDIAAKVAETASNTGVISVKVIDASGNPITNANVHIFNANPSPNVDIQTTTDNQGLVVIPNLPLDSTNAYQITASLAGYSTDQTIADPPGAQTAVELNLNVLLQQVTTVTMAIDRTSTLNVHVVNTSGTAMPSLPVTISGAKQIKLSPTVLKYSAVSSTDSSGNIALPGMEWDSYSYSLQAGYYLVSVQPYAPSILSPNTSQTVNLVVSTSSSAPTISAATPISGATGTTPVSIKLTGTNLNGSASVSLKHAGQPDITGTSVTSSSGNTVLNFNVDLTAATTGAWDIVVTTSGGGVTQTGGFSVTP